MSSVIIHSVAQIEMSWYPPEGVILKDEDRKRDEWCLKKPGDWCVTFKDLIYIAADGSQQVVKEASLDVNEQDAEVETCE